jgi:hypothetical protein
MRTGDDGLVERFSIRWLGRCARPGYAFRGATQTTPISPFEVHTRDRFVDIGGYREPLGHGRRAVYRARTIGNRLSERRWRGIFRIRVRVMRGDRVIHRCRAITRWRVHRRD